VFASLVGVGVAPPPGVGINSPLSNPLVTVVDVVIPDP